MTTAKAPTPAQEKRAAAALERTRRRVAEASGADVGLPALVTADGDVRRLSGTELAQLLRDRVRAGAAALDIESTGYPIGHPQFAVRTIQLGCSRWAVNLDASDPGQLAAARAVLARLRIIVVFSAAADLAPLQHIDVADWDTWDRVLDASLTVRMAFPGVRPQGGLKGAAEALLEAPMSVPAEKARAALARAGKWLTNTDPTTPVERSFWYQVDSGCEVMARYAASDVIDTAALASMAPRRDAREHDLQRVVSRISVQGMSLRVPEVESQTARYEEDAAREWDWLNQHVSNPGSTKEVGLWLHALGIPLPETSIGYSTDKQVLRKVLGRLPVEHPGREAITRLLAWRKASKILSTYLHPWHVQTTHGDGRIRPHIYTLGADTGRMSSARPNLQNVPRAGGLRPCFGADPGMLFISADLSGIEIRVMAALSGDPDLTRYVVEGKDLHMAIAREVFGPGADKRDRYTSKAIVFGRFYGGGVDTLAGQTGAPPEVVGSVIDVLDDMFPTLRQWSYSVIQQVQNGMTEVELYSGRVLFLDPEYGYKAPNWLVQGTAREIIADAILEWSGGPYDRGEFILPIHDEIVTQAPAEEAEAATEHLVRCMTTTFMGLPVVAEANAPSPFWLDATE